LVEAARSVERKNDAKLQDEEHRRFIGRNDGQQREERRCGERGEAMDGSTIRVTSLR
jgi:hypothetical protein